MDDSKLQKIDEQSGFKFKFTIPRIVKGSDHLEALAMNKPEYHSRDFFNKSEFRGLFLADHQEAIGEKALKCVEELNQSVLGKFKDLQQFNNSLGQMKAIKLFYKSGMFNSLSNHNRGSSNYKTSASKLNRSHMTNMTSGGQDISDYTFGKSTSRTYAQQNQSFDNYNSLISKKTAGDAGIYEYSKRLYDTFKDQSLSQSVRDEYNKSVGKRIGEMDEVDALQNRSISSIRTKRNPLNTALLATSTLQNNDSLLTSSDYHNYKGSFKNSIENSRFQTNTAKNFDRNDMGQRNTRTVYQSKNGRLQPLGSVESPQECFEEPSVQIDKFDKMVSNGGHRKFKYPRIELQKISEEEIKKYSTNEDMGEVKRSVYLLKKGYQSQKVTIIENLYRLMKEPGANEELLPIILNSMDIWDEKMQTDCARHFEKHDVIKLMTSQNQSKLMEECVNYIINADITHEEVNTYLIQYFSKFITEWLKVFKKLVIYLPMDYIKNHVIKKIIDLPSLKQQYPRRKIGFEMFCYIIEAKGEEGFKADPNLMKILVNMCTDTNWKVRKQGAQFLYDYLRQLHSMQKKNKKGDEEVKGSLKLPQKPPVLTSQPSQASNEVVRVTKTRFKSHFYDLMVELAADEERLVRMEGIEIMTEYLLIVKKKLIETDYIPNLDSMLKLAEDPVTADEIKIRITQISGKIIDKLAQCMLATKYEPMFMEFFKVMIKDRNPDVRIQAAFNLPCFYFTFRSIREDNMEYFDQTYRDLICDAQNQNADILKTLSASIHEALSLISYDQGSLGNLSECLRVLMNSSHRQVRDALSTNIDQIIEHYIKENDLKEMIETIILNQSQGSNNGQNLVLPNAKDFGQKTTKNFQIQQEEVVGRGGTGSKQNRAKAQLKIDEESMGGGSDNKNNVVKLQEYLELDLVPEEYHKEFLYSKLLEDILALNRSIMNDKGNWRTQELFVQNLGSQLQNFNAVEVLDTLGQQMFELMRSNCDQVKHASAFFICNLINIQYKQQRRQELIDLVISEFAKSNSFCLRRAYISFCVSAVKVFSFKTFKTFFLEDYMTMVNDPVAEVRMKFLQSAPIIRPFLEQEIDLMLKFNNSLNYLQTQDPSKSILELAQKINTQLIKSKGQVTIGYNESQERLKQAYEKKLQEREVFEEEQRKKKSEEEEDSKFDYLTLLVNTTKKYGNMRRVGGGAITFKQYLNKKSTPSAGIKQFSSPPVIGKGNVIGGTQPPSFTTGPSSTTNSTSNPGSSLLLTPSQQNQALLTPNTITQTSHFKKRTSQMVVSTSKTSQIKNQTGLFPPIGTVIKDQNQGKDAIRTVRKSELILQSQVNSNLLSEVGINSATNSNYQPNSFSSASNKRSITQKIMNDGATSTMQPKPNGNTQMGPIPNEVHSILKKNQISVTQGSSLNGFSHSNSLSGPYTNNYLSTGQSGSYSNGISSTLVNGGGQQILSLNKKRLSSEDLDRPVQSGSNSNTVSRTNLNSQNQKH